MVHLFFSQKTIGGVIWLVGSHRELEPALSPSTIEKGRQETALKTAEVVQNFRQKLLLAQAEVHIPSGGSQYR
jgi:hypothetical protein